MGETDNEKTSTAPSGGRGDSETTSWLHNKFKKKLVSVKVVVDRQFKAAATVVIEDINGDSEGDDVGGMDPQNELLARDVSRKGIKRRRSSFWLVVNWVVCWVMIWKGIKRRSVYCRASAIDFNDFIDDAGLIDVPMIGEREPRYPKARYACMLAPRLRKRTEKVSCRWLIDRSFSRIGDDGGRRRSELWRWCGGSSPVSVSWKTRAVTPEKKMEGEVDEDLEFRRRFSAKETQRDAKMIECEMQLTDIDVAIYQGIARMLLWLRDRGFSVCVELYPKLLEAAICLIHEDRDHNSGAVLSNTETYYNYLVPQWLQHYSYADYVSKAEFCLNQEKERTSEFLHQTSVEKLLRVWILVQLWCDLDLSNVTSIESLQNTTHSLLKSPMQIKVTNAVILSTLWMIWKDRNERNFNNNGSSPEKLLDDIKAISFT
ncbi:hypothetical protein LXL04_016781 [Taraxacum kok-saghyz]